MMSKIAIIALVFAAVFVYSEAAQALQQVKLGERVEIDLAKGGKALSRTNKAGKAIFNFEGANKGVFVSEGGKKLGSPSNYELKSGGVLVIKKVGNDDLGAYAKEPNTPVGHTAGNVLVLVL